MTTQSRRQKASKAALLFGLPRWLGRDPDSGLDIWASLGRYGPHVRRGRLADSPTLYAALPDVDALLKIDLQMALTLLAAREAAAQAAR